jgi:hypothetical protein
MSKVMFILKKNEVYDAENPLVIKVNDEKLEVVDSFAYVGNFENSWGTMDHHMNQTLSKLGSTIISMAKRIFEHHKIKLKTKMMLYKVMIIANRLYGCPTWNLTKPQLEKLESLHFCYLRKKLGISRREHCSHVALIAKYATFEIEIDTMKVMIGKQRLVYLGHVLRMQEDRLPLRMLNGRLKVGENSSAKETDFHQSVINVLNSFGIPQSELLSRRQEKVE